MNEKCNGEKRSMLKCRILKHFISMQMERLMLTVHPLNTYLDERSP